MTTAHLILAQGNLAAQPGGLWGFIILVLLILFVTLVATDGSRHNDK